MYKVSYRLLVLLITTMVGACDLTIVDETTPRSYVGLTTAHAAPLKIEIAKSLIMSPGKSVPQAGALMLPPLPGLAPMKFDFGWVTESGAIVIQNTKFGVIVLQEPTVTGGVVKWSCVVHPAEAKPKLCGSEYENSLLQKR